MFMKLILDDLACLAIWTPIYQSYDYALINAKNLI